MTPKEDCAYCGAPATSEDHVPPQSLLIGVPRSARPSVPACEACNNGVSDDDEYFRDAIVRYHRVADRPEAQHSVEAMLRAVTKPEKRAYARRAFQDLVELPAVTMSGIHLGKQPAFRVDGARLERTAARYIRGLHFHEFGARVPVDHQVIARVEPERIIDRQDALAKLFSAGELRMVKEKVFFYRHVTPPDVPSASAWFLCFFDAYPVLGIVRPTG